MITGMFHGVPIIFIVGPHLVCLQNVVEALNINFTCLVLVDYFPNRFKLQRSKCTFLILFLLDCEIDFQKQILALKFVQITLFILVKTIVKNLYKICSLLIELVDRFFNFLLIV